MFGSYRAPANVPEGKGKWRKLKKGMGVMAKLKGEGAVRYEQQAEGLIVMLAERGESNLSSLAYTIKKLQKGDSFAFTQMVEAMMSIAHSEEFNEDDDDDDDDGTKMMRAATEWAKLMGWAKKKVMEDNEEIATAHIHIKTCRRRSRWHGSRASARTSHVERSGRVCTATRA